MKVSEPYTIFPRTLKSGKTVYYYQYRMDNGIRSTAKSTGCTTEASAKRFCQKLFNSGAFEKTSSTRFSVFSRNFFTHDSEYYKWKKVNNSQLTDESLLAYDKFLRNQLLPYFENYQISAITKSEVKNWIIWASDRWSAKTVNNAQTVLNIILNQAVDKDMIPFNPAQGLSFRKIEKKERILMTKEEIKATYESKRWSNETIRKAFLLDAITGMRISEIAGLRNQDLHENYIDLQHSYSRQFGLGDTKTKQKRCVPIPEGLDLHNDSCEWLFPAENGKPFNICRMHDNLLRVWEDVGIDYKTRNLTTHTIRNFFISYCLSENVPKPKVKAVIGHKDEDMTDWYTYWKPEMLKEVYDAQLKLYNFIKG